VAESDPFDADCQRKILREHTPAPTALTLA